jgi:aryl-alcohol dehydrogenase-like predicted oxidoreductase
MNYRRLGATGLLVSEIGFGAWGIGGSVNGATGYGPADDRESKAALRRAYDLGVTFFDTAAFYGYGHSERLIGEALKGVRPNAVIATKVGFLDAEGAQDFSPAHIRGSLESSLKQLQTDYVDLYQLHSPSLAALEADYRILEVLEQLQREGKTRALGISLASPGDGSDSITKFGFKAIQVNFNLVDQRALDIGLFNLCAQRDVGVIVRTPLCFGFLTGAYSGDTQYDPNDHRKNWSSDQITRWAEAGELFSAVVGDGAGQTQAQMALRFCLSYDCLSTTIPGMRTVDHVEENLRASHMGSYAPHLLQAMEKVYQENTFFLGN